MEIAQFQQQLEDKGIQLNSQQLQQFERYYEVLVEWNEKINLTSITEKKEVYLKHFYDSISAAFYYDFSKPLSLCDVGAGAGFPSIPLKICFPHLHISIVDSLKKRITFLDHLAQELNLKHVSFYHDRAETFGQNKQFRESFDLVTARAVARLSVLSELCLPLVKVNGDFVALKASSAQEELEKANKAISLLGGTVQHVSNFKLPLEESERNIIVIRKERATPKKYPRKPGTPNKMPIE
ncbi:16S rRNA (guanine(527)-N(7))-methyltransferase RsmG [Bacillus sp. FJAT-47783]|uniref:16S rRNA (guanine(527)-N(7))-methyltransferase RsmG n=1 Tax=Bacillus sp. FJAT-47783 TaxID=2922712 RepID=UPI001FAB79EC|nr:16S rRNA (guanine(527)-N(7))-methyltransferase RsmG [Bacillus sp. FJAT-47783]